MSQRPRSTCVLVHPNEILAALVGLKDVRVLAYVRRGPDVELMIEQVTGVLSCSLCGQRAQVKERPVVHYVEWMDGILGPDTQAPHLFLPTLSPDHRCGYGQ